MAYNHEQLISDLDKVLNDTTSDIQQIRLYDAPQPVVVRYARDPKEKATKKLGPKEASTLKAWVAKHKANPYPSTDEKEDLCDLTGLTMKQVTNWFINMRKRNIRPKKKNLRPPNQISMQKFRTELVKRGRDTDNVSSEEQSSEDSE